MAAQGRRRPPASTGPRRPRPAGRSRRSPGGDGFSVVLMAAAAAAHRAGAVRRRRARSPTRSSPAPAARQRRPGRHPERRRGPAPRARRASSRTARSTSSPTCSAPPGSRRRPADVAETSAAHPGPGPRHLRRRRPGRRRQPGRHRPDPRRAAGHHRARSRRHRHASTTTAATTAQAGAGRAAGRPGPGRRPATRRSSCASSSRNWSTCRRARRRDRRPSRTSSPRPGDYVVQVRLGERRPGAGRRPRRWSSRSRTRCRCCWSTASRRRRAVRPGDRMAARRPEPVRDGPGAAATCRPGRKVLSEAQFADAGLGDLTPYDCVFLCDVARLGAAEVRRLEAHLRRGGGVVFCLGPQRRSGGVQPPALPQRRGHPAGPAARAGSGRRRTASSRSTPTRTTLQRAAARRLRRRRRPGQPAGGAASASTCGAELPRARAGPRKVPVVHAAGRRPRRPAAKCRPAPPRAACPRATRPVVEWPRAPRPGRPVTTTVNMDWTTWPPSPSFPALMQELLRFAVAGRLREQAARRRRAARGVPARPAAPGWKSTVAHRPTAAPRRTRTPGPATTPPCCAGPTPTRAASTGPSIGQHPQEHLFAVNVPTATEAQQASESDLARADRDELQTAYPGLGLPGRHRPGDVVHAGGPAAGRRRGRPAAWASVVARWLLLAVLGAAAGRGGAGLAVRPLQHRRRRRPGGRPPPGRLLPGLVPCRVRRPGVPALAGVLLHAAWTGDFLGFLPDGVRARRSSAALDVPPPAPGEGTRWRLEFAPYLSDARPPTPGWSAAWPSLAVAWSSGIYRREGRTAGAGLQAAPGRAARLLVLLLTLAVLLPQLRLLVRAAGLAGRRHAHRRLAEHEHRRPLPATRACRRRPTGWPRLAGLTEPERLQLAQALLTRPDRDWLTHAADPAQGQGPRLPLLQPGRPAGRASPSRTERDAAVAGDPAACGPTARSSQLGTAVRQVLNDFRGSSLAAVVMLTDGVTTEGEDLAQAAAYAAPDGRAAVLRRPRRRPRGPRPVLHDLQVEDSVYVNDRVVFEARLTGQGYTDLTVPVVAVREGQGRQAQGTGPQSGHGRSAGQAGQGPPGAPADRAGREGLRPRRAGPARRGATGRQQPPRADRLRPRGQADQGALRRGLPALRVPLRQDLLERESDRDQGQQDAST